MNYATLVHPALAHSRPIAIADRPRNRLFLWGVGLAVAVSSIVLVEPAPVDALVVALLMFGLLAGIIGFRGIQPAAIIPLSLFVLANVVSLYDPIDSTRAAWYVFVTFYLCLSWTFFVAVLWSYGTKGMQTIIYMYSFAAMLCIVPSLLSYFHLIGFQNYLLLYGRPKGTFKDPNVYGPYLIPVALFAIAGLTFTRKTMKTTLAQTLIILISAGGIFLSYSRACWINFVVSVVVYFVVAFTFRPAGSPTPFPLSRAIVLMAGLAVCLLGVLQIPAVKQMMSHRVTSTGLQGYDQDRFRTQRMALDSVLDRPLGIGPGQAELAFHYATHSSYMRVLSENGFLGEAGFIIFIVVCLFRALIMGWKTQDPFWQKIFFITAACILGHIINSGVVDTIHWRHFWLLLALPWFNPAQVPAALLRN